MSNEIFEFSVLIDEKFDLQFNWAKGFWAILLKFVD
jgi:hypothetical protein